MSNSVKAKSEVKTEDFAALRGAVLVVAASTKVRAKVGTCATRRVAG